MSHEINPFGEFDDLEPACTTDYPSRTWDGDKLVTDMLSDLNRLPIARLTESGEVYKNRPVAEFTLSSCRGMPKEIAGFMEQNLIPYYVIFTDGNNGPRLITSTGIYEGSSILAILRHEFLESEADIPGIEV